MKITETHLKFWLEKKAPLPKWAKELEEKREKNRILFRTGNITLIDSIVNLSVGRKHCSKGFLMNAGNSINLLRLARKNNGANSSYDFTLQDLITRCSIDYRSTKQESCKRHLTYFRRWLKRLRRGKP